MIERFRGLIHKVEDNCFTYRKTEVLSGDSSEVGQVFKVFTSYFPSGLSIKPGDEVLLSRDGEKPVKEMWTIEVLSSFT